MRDFAYLVSAVCFILALKGLSSPRTARNGNLVGAGGAVLAVIVVFTTDGLNHILPILVAVAAGTAVGAVVARRVQMTAMPQLVAIFNGVGGGAAALVALLELADTDGGLSLAAAVFSMIVGTVSFSGSMLTFAKLQELMTGRPVIFPGGPFVFGGTLAVAIGLGRWSRARRAGRVRHSHSGAVARRLAAVTRGMLRVDAHESGPHLLMQRPQRLQIPGPVCGLVRRLEDLAVELFDGRRVTVLAEASGCRTAARGGD